MSRAIINDLNINIELPKPSSFGFKLIQAHTTSDETIHKASYGLYKSFEQWIESDKELIDYHFKDNSHFLTLPILLIQGNLFEAFLDDSNQIQIEEIKSAVWKFNTGQYRDTFSVIVINEKYLSELADNIIAYGEKNIEFLSSNPQSQLKNIKRKDLRAIKKEFKKK